MARSTRSGNGSTAPEASGNGAMPPDIDAARNVLATGLHQGHRLLQWLTRAQALQADALKAWETALDTAASQAEQAAAWDELFALQRDLMREGLARMTNSETALLSSWLELQGEFAQQMQDRSGELTRKLWSGASHEESAPAGAALTPTAWLEQSQAALQAMLRPWGAMAGATQGR